MVTLKQKVCLALNCDEPPISIVAPANVDLCFAHAEETRRKLFDRLVAAERRFSFDFEAFQYALRNYNEFITKYLKSVYD